jgi:peptidoglycan/LPS O-acetylase OafA/YrhL
MLRQRNPVFDNLRAICMLGVIAIHLGSFVLDSGTPTEHIFMLFEILSRYSVPTFFFISGYGLFYSYPLESRLDYLKFLKKRLRTIGIPYVLVSLFYIAYIDAIYPTPDTWTLPTIFFKLCFGTACYHIYFLVILIWFYICFPLWRYLMRFMEICNLKYSLPVLALLQLHLYAFSEHFWAYPQWVVDMDWLYNLCQYRLNYLPLFYLFVFMLGGAIARHYGLFKIFLNKHPYLITMAFLASATTNAGLFYRYTYKWGMDWEFTANTFQQLSTPGFVYTITAIFFFSMIIDRFPEMSQKLLGNFSNRSFVIYLIHPFIIDVLIYQLQCQGIMFNQVPMPPFYLAVVLISYLLAEIWHFFRQKTKKAFNF